MASAFSCALLVSVLGLSLAGCAGAPTSGASSSVQPSFYQPLDRAEAQIDPIAARDLFSIYRTGKGLALSVLTQIYSVWRKRKCRRWRARPSPICRAVLWRSA